MFYDVPKKHQNVKVILVSSIHHVDNKPDMIIDYNNTKRAVDTLDKMCQKYAKMVYSLYLFFVEHYWSKFCGIISLVKSSNNKANISTWKIFHEV